jgi:uncharacterized RDD family membrane protein YckC
MMPQLVTLRVERPEHRPIRIWIPVLPVLLVFSPIVVLAVLGAVVACVIFQINVIAALAGGWRVICALPGSRLDMAEDRMGVLVTIR